MRIWLSRRFAVFRAAVRDPRIAVGLAMLSVVVVSGLFAPWLAPYDPLKLGVGRGAAPPSPEHLLGTDSLGRDLLSRLMYGSQISIIAAGTVAVGSLTIGLPIGLVAGYAGGRFDALIGRILDILFAFPVILAALVLTTVLGPSLETAVIALVVVYAPITIRFVRGAVLVERDREFVIAARVTGASGLAIIVRHLVPNVTSPLLVLLTSITAFTILAEAGLSYLGFGTQAPTPSWGRMLVDEGSTVFTKPHLAIVPGLAIAYTVLALNLLGDGLRDLFDPRYGSR